MILFFDIYKDLVFNSHFLFVFCPFSSSSFYHALVPFLRRRLQQFFFVIFPFKIIHLRYSTGKEIEVQLAPRSINFVC